MILVGESIGVGIVKLLILNSNVAHHIRILEELWNNTHGFISLSENKEKKRYNNGMSF